MHAPGIFNKPHLMRKNFTLSKSRLIIHASFNHPHIIILLRIICNKSDRPRPLLNVSFSWKKKRYLVDQKITISSIEYFPAIVLVKHEE